MDRWTKLVLRRHSLHRQRAASQAPPIGRMWVGVGDRKMHVRYGGAASNPRVVVLVHGLAVSSLYMTPLLAHLVEDHRVLAPDLPGFGYTDGPWRGMRVEELADWLGAFIERMGLDAPLLVGNSMGCQTAVDLAVRRPELTRGVVLQGPTFDPFARNTPQQMLRWIITSMIEPTSMGLVLMHDYARCGLRRLVGTFRHALGDPIERKLPKIQCPAMVVRGTSDRVISPLWAQRAAELLPQGLLRQVPGAAHTINYEAPLELARVIQPFVRRCYESSEYPGRVGGQARRAP